MNLFHKLTPSRHRMYLHLFLVPLCEKLYGDNTLEGFKNYFNQVVREAKISCNDHDRVHDFKLESKYLARCMLKYEDLKQEIMKINSLDDVDEDMANRILLRLEPAYARSGHEA